jgi:hypothetical protein
MWRVALRVGMVGAGIVAGTAAGTAAGIVAGIVVGIMTEVMIAVGIGFGLMACLWSMDVAITGRSVSKVFAMWPWYGIARIWLALRHRLPWRLMSFLADAHRRGVLRQAGAVYQFRHIELQHRLARHPRPKTPAYHPPSRPPA